MDSQPEWNPTTGEVRAIVDELRPLLDAMARKERQEQQAQEEQDATYEPSSAPRTSSAMRPSMPFTKRPDSSVE
jgi:hypothetical protein